MIAGEATFAAVVSSKRPKDPLHRHDEESQDCRCATESDGEGEDAPSAHRLVGCLVGFHRLSVRKDCRSGLVAVLARSLGSGLGIGILAVASLACCTVAFDRFASS